METQPRHVVLDARAIVLLLSVALTRVQLRRLLLTPEDRDGVEASMGTFLAVEHGPAVLVVVLEGFGAEGVGGADPLGYSTGHYGLVSVGHCDLRTADFHSGLGLLAKVVAAFALEIILIVRRHVMIRIFSFIKSIVYLRKFVLAMICEICVNSIQFNSVHLLFYLIFYACSTMLLIPFYFERELIFWKNSFS